MYNNAQSIQNSYENTLNVRSNGQIVYRNCKKSCISRMVILLCIMVIIHKDKVERIEGLVLKW